MQGLTDRNIAALIGGDVLRTILQDRRTWTCRWCGGVTTILNEVCARCGREDCSQGKR